MRGIKIKNGATFVEYKGRTYRLSADGWTVSPIAFSVLEWDLRTEPPHTYDYMTESDIRNMGEGVYAELIALSERLLTMLP